MGADPTVWILWRRRKGDLDQMLCLVNALGWRHEIKKLSFRSPGIPALAGLLLKPQSDPLFPPWPDVILCAEALPSIIARKLKANSRGAIRTVCLGRPAGTPSAFDLVITTAQYRLPPATNIVELALPLTSPRAKETGAPDDRTKKSPITALFVGGSSFPDFLDVPAARAMMLCVHQHVEKRGGTLLATASPRTSKEVADFLARNTPAPHFFQAFKAGNDTYQQTLASAEEIIVTSDSVSMTADALETGKPVFIYPLPQKLNLQWRLAEWLYEHAVMQRSGWLAPMRWLFDAGVIESNADRRLLFSKLVAERRLNWFGEAPPNPKDGTSRPDLQKAVERVRGLINSQEQ
jgi:mitochondrial fission protein ELM1